MLHFYTDEEVAAIPWDVTDRDGNPLDLTGWTFAIRIIRASTNDLIVTQTSAGTYTVDDTSPNFVLDTWEAATQAAIVTSLQTTVPATSAVFKVIPYGTSSGDDMALKASGKALEVIFELPAT